MGTVKNHMDFTGKQMEAFEELAGDSEYWQNALSFYKEKHLENFGDLSRKQQGWLDKIYDDVLDQVKK